MGRGTFVRIAVPAITLAAALLIAGAQPALADNCSSQADCARTAGYNAAIALAGGGLALAAGLFGNAIAGGTEAPPAGSEAGGDATVPTKRRGCCLGWFTMIAGIPVALIALVLLVSGLL